VFVARRWRWAWMQGVATKRPAGVLEQYVEDREGAQRSSQAQTRLRSKTLVRNAG